MATKKISELDAATSVAGADIIPIVQGGATKSASKDVLFTSPTIKGANSLAAVGVTSQMTADGTFDTDTGWTVTAGWAVSEGKATHTTGVTPLTGTTTMASALVYKAVITISGRTAGSVGVKFGTYDCGVTLNADGAHTVYGLCSPTTTIIITPTTDFNGSIETVTLVNMVESTPDMIIAASGVSVDGDMRHPTGSYSFGLGKSNLSVLIPDLAYAGGLDSGGPATPYRGINNISVGDRALRSVVTGKFNVAVGQESMLHLTTGVNNTGVGDSALNNCVSGYDNTAVGANCLEHIIASSENVAVGSAAGRALTTGSWNVLLGRYAGVVQTAASGCVVVGRGAMAANVGGNANVAIGQSSLQANVGVPSNGWGYNTAVGYYSLASLSSGVRMIAIGYQAGYGATPANAPLTDDYGILIGYQANRSVASATKLTNYLAIGTTALADKDNQFVYGNTSVVEHLFRAGKVIINNALELTAQADPPASAVEGMLYADTDHHLYYYNGSTWVQLDNGA